MLDGESPLGFLVRKFLVSETSLAIRLADGMNLSDAVRDMAVTESSIRIYGQRIFLETGETGIGRQTELVRLILKSVVSLADVNRSHKGC